MRVRTVSLACVAILASAWAGGLIVMGIWLIALAPATLRLASTTVTIGPSLRVMGALAAISAGQLVFLCLVADRFFPRASRGVVWPVELASCATLLVGVGGLAAGLGATLIWG